MILIYIVIALVVLGFLVIINNPHSGFSIKFGKLFSFDKKESPPLVHNTETAKGANFDGSSIFPESGRQAFLNDAPDVSAKGLNVKENNTIPLSDKKSIIKGNGKYKPYIHVDEGAITDMDNVHLEVSELINKSKSTKITNTDVY